MSVNGNTHDHDRGDDAAAYVLGALGPREAAEYLRHLTVCTALPRRTRGARRRWRTRWRAPCLRCPHRRTSDDG